MPLFINLFLSTIIAVLTIAFQEQMGISAWSMAWWFLMVVMCVVIGAISLLVCRIFDEL